MSVRRIHVRRPPRQTSGIGDMPSPKQTRRLTAANEDLVRPVFIPQLWRVTLPRLELDGDLGVVEQVCPLEDNAEAALADLLADAVVHADDIAAA